MLLDALNILSMAGAWDTELSDADIDLFDAEISTARLALMTSYNVGEVVWLARDEAPDGMLVCDGAVYNRADYPLLYSVIGSAYQTGPDTFKTPNLIGVFARGGNTPGQTGGEDSHTLTSAEMPIHAHSTGNSFSGLAFSPGELPVLTPNPLPALTGNAGGGLAHNNIPRYETLLPCLIAY